MPYFDSNNRSVIYFETPAMPNGTHTVNVTVTWCNETNPYILDYVLVESPQGAIDSGHQQNRSTAVPLGWALNFLRSFLSRCRAVECAGCLECWGPVRFILPTVRGFPVRENFALEDGTLFSFQVFSSSPPLLHHRSPTARVTVPIRQGVSPGSVYSNSLRDSCMVPLCPLSCNKRTPG